MRLFDAGLAAGVVAILALAAPAGAMPVLSAAATLKTAADNPVTQVQWIGWGNGWQAPRYRWHKRPVFFVGIDLATAPPMATPIGGTITMVRAARPTPLFPGGTT
jgi:hypothetical protein